MTYNFTYVSDYLKEIIEPATVHSHTLDCSLSYHTYSNAFIAPFAGWNRSIGCALNSVGKVIKDSECYEWKENDQCYDTSKAVNENKTVIFLGFLLTVFGHAFIDNLRKIWFIKSDICRNLLENGAELVYTTSWNKPLPDRIIDAFSMSGIDINKARRIDRLTSFDSVVIPDNCIKASEYGRLFTKEYVKIIDSIKRRCQLNDTQKTYEKVYFTRTALKKSRDVGEIKLVKIFEKLGYTIIAPEKMPLINQIQLMQKCSYFASTEGSISHLTLFCRPGTDVVLINKADYLNYHQVMINEFADLNVTYIKAHHSSLANRFYPWWGPFYLYQTKYLMGYVGDSSLVFPYYLHLGYWYYRLLYSRLIIKLKPSIYKIIKWFIHI